MRSIITAIFLLLGVGCFSQQTASGNAVIEYRIFNNTDSANTMYGTLSVNGPVTIFLTKFSGKVYNNPKEEAAYTNRVTTDFDYLKTDHKQKEILFFDYLAGNIVLIKDDYAALNWTITEETRTIGEYLCIKATTSYRGRSWVAWFTPEVSLPYGPWKLHGLPGLILEAADADNIYVWKIEKIEYRRDTVFDKEFSKLLKTRNKKPMPLKQFIEEDAEANANENAKMIQENSDITEIIMAPRSGYELIYEWEQ